MDEKQNNKKKNDNDNNKKWNLKSNIDHHLGVHLWCLCTQVYVFFLVLVVYYCYSLILFIYCYALSFKTVRIVLDQRKGWNAKQQILWKIDLWPIQYLPC